MTHSTFFPDHFDGTVTALAVFDDGSEPALSAGVFFATASTLPAAPAGALNSHPRPP